MLRQIFHSTAASGLLVAGAQADTIEHWRLFVADHTDPVVRAIDLDGTEAGRFETGMFSALSRSTSGRSIFAVQGDAGKVQVISSGVTFEDHGDHADLTVTDPELLPLQIEMAKPAHFVENRGMIALFDDGTGEVALFSETQVLDDTFDPQIIATGAAHHGLAAPFGGHVVYSLAAPAEGAPRPGLQVATLDGSPVGEMVPCPGVHGQARSGGDYAFGCTDGVVIAAAQRSGPPVLTHYPTGHMGEGNVSTLKGGTAMQFFLGNYGPQAVVIFEPGAEEPFRKVDLPTRRVDFALDPARPANAYILTEDGQLHLLDVVAGEIAQSVQLTAAYSMDGHWRDPRPRLAMAGNHIAVTDPLVGLIRLVSTDTLEEERTIEVEGVPYGIVAVGGSGASH